MFEIVSGRANMFESERQRGLEFAFKSCGGRLLGRPREEMVTACLGYLYMNVCIRSVEMCKAELLARSNRSHRLPWIP